MIESPIHREELADFLRTRRARLRPSDVGLLGGKRRRTPGLRREEVALLANIGVTWYTRLEQGQPINVSPEVLASISKALQLAEKEREHLFVLAGQTPSEPSVAEGEHVSEVLLRVLAALDPNPAVIVGRRYDVLAWNRAAVAMFGDYEAMEGLERNMLWRFFMRPSECRVIMPRWADIAPRIVAQFRAIAAKYLDDLAFQQLIATLVEGSPVFRDLWSRHDVRGMSDGFKYLYHPELGPLTLEYTSLRVADAPDMRLVVYTAEKGSAAERKLRGLIDLAPA